MAVDQKDIKRINEGLKKRAVSLPALKRMVAKMRASSKKKTALPDLKAQAYNLRVFETQLKNMEQKLDDDVLSVKAFEALPASQQRLILTRLENIKKRVEKQVTDTGKLSKESPKFENAPFTCRSDFDKCMKMKSTTAAWCYFAFYVCVMRSLLPFMK